MLVKGATGISTDIRTWVSIDIYEKGGCTITSCAHMYKSPQPARFQYATIYIISLVIVAIDWII